MLGCFSPHAPAGVACDPATPVCPDGETCRAQDGRFVCGGPLAIDTTKHQAIGTCPVCKEGQVYELENAFACERALASPKTCSFRVSKIILQREIPREQVQKLMTTGKTDLLPKFISKKGRPFSAHLKLENGKIGFEFAEAGILVLRFEGSEHVVSAFAPTA